MKMMSCRGFGVMLKKITSNYLQAEFLIWIQVNVVTVTASQEMAVRMSWLFSKYCLFATHGI